MCLLFFSFSTKKTIVSAQNTLASQAKVAPIKIKVNEKQELFVEGKPVSLEKLSTAINRLATSNDSANQSQPQVELDVTGNLGMALLNSIKKQLEKANAVLTMVTADSIKMTGENLEEAFKGIAFTAKDTLQITLDDGNTVLGTSTSPVQGVQETEPLKSTLSNKAPVPLSTTKQTGTVSLPLKTSDTLEISGSAEWPRVPMIAYRTDQGPISAELKNLVDSYAKLKKSYYDGVIRFVEHKQGSKEQLMHQYTQIMDLYKNYTKLATEEGVYALPEPSMSRMVWDRLPPHSQKLIDHVIGLAEKGAAFYLDDKKISTEKAVEQLKNNHELRINSMFEKDTVMEVKMSSF